VKLVVNDAALWSPVENARGERLPHVHTGSLDPAPPQRAQFDPEELVQRFLFPLPPKPKRRK